MTAWLAMWVVLCAPLFAAAATFLPPEQAFRLSARLFADQHISLTFDAAPGYYLYRDRFQFSAEPAAVALESPVLPPGVVKYDETFGKEVETYHGAVTVQVAVKMPEQAVAGGALAGFTLRVVNQGCADKGLCYPPQERLWRVAVAGDRLTAIEPMGDAAPALAAQAERGTANARSTETSWSARVDAQVNDALRSGRWVSVVGLFFIAGALLSLTPCVLPMVPILSSIIVGRRTHVTRRHGLAMAVAYSLGMAVVYTALGVAAGLAGQGLAAALQTPWVLGSFAVLLVLLALSMFGVYELQLPERWQSAAHEAAAKLPMGRWGGTFLMGGLSALVVSPCVAAPLAGALVYISQTGDAVTGGAALFSMAAGMSLPLLLVGASAGALLPRSGPWMVGIKRLFGVVMVALALWLAAPVWQPWLQTVAPSLAAHLTVNGEQRVAFQRVRSVAELDAALRGAGRPVMLDFYADWCVSCKEMEAFTFTDPAVRARLDGLLLLQADVTANTADDQALLKRFGLFGPPGTLFFDAQGRELEPLRVIGFQDAQRFLQTLQGLPASVPDQPTQRQPAGQSTNRS